MKAWIAYAVCAVVWGSTYFAIALGITSFTPFGMVATRYLLGGAVAFGLSRLLGEDLPLLRDLPHLAFVGVLLLGCSNALVTWAEGFVASGVTAILCSMTPLLYGLMGREALGLRRWCGLGLGLLGVVILSRPGQASFHAGGIAAILLATVTWAYGTLHGKRHVKGRGLLGQVAVQMGAGGLLALLLVPFTGGFLHAPVTLKAALAVGYLTVFGSVVAFSAFAYLAKVWSPTRMGTYAYLNPLVAVLLGSAFLGEPFGPRLVAGMAVILASVAIVQFQARPVPAENA
ncbi:EamA family transporter [Geothrix sp. 21YS21S-2]|uniref:EamA family transporter n=1 Tax=Geothrix sp. 21YS21S-2 TaxID=3068893 RepID=UPI0027B88FF1|nr:EamA family transporter [Geothrix sp. 21YS21S-2]